MKLHGIELTNFRRHVHTRITFRPGLTAIIGPNGAGKSTILEAVLWVLYGSDALRGVNADLRWEDAAAKAPVKGSLFITVDRTYYRIDRTLSTATLLEGDSGKELAKSTTGVNEAVRALLKVDHKDFANIFFTGQQDLKFLGVMKGADRSRYLNRIIGYYRVQLAQERARKEKAKYEAELKGLRSADDLSAEAAAAAVAELQVKVQTLKQQGKAAWDAAQLAHRMYRQFGQDELRAASGRTVQIRALRARIAELHRSLDDARGRLDKQGQALQARTEAELIVDEDEGQIATIIEQRAALLDALRDQLEEAEADWRRRQAEAKADEFNHRNLMGELEGQIDALRSAEGGTCPVCSQDLPSHRVDAVVKAAQQQHEATMLRWSEAQSRIEELKATPLLIVDKRDLVERARRSLANAEGQLEAAQRQNEELRAQHRELMETAEDYDADEHEQAVRDVEEFQQRLVEAEASIEAELAASENDAPVFERAAELEAEARKCDAEVHRLKGEYEKAKAALQAATEEAERAADRERKIEAGELLVAINRELDVALGNLRTDLNVKLRPELCAIASAHVARMMPGMYEALDLDSDYNPTLILPNGEPRRVISGGEGDIANLALRLAASEVVAERSGRPIEMLALDEIFGQLDRERKQLTLDALRALRDRFPQVILITHHEEVLEACDQIVRVELGEHLESIVRS